jgi:DNA-binding response OmpR family regulator
MAMLWRLGWHMLNDKRILVVEDEPLLAMVIADALAAAGAVVLGPVGTVKEALGLAGSFLKSGGIDGAVLDVNLHGEMVWSVANALDEGDVPYVMQTAYAYTDLDQQPTAPVINKPYLLAELVDAVEAITDRPANGIQPSASPR